MGRVERDAELEQIFIGALGEISRDREFIISSLTLMESDDMRRKVVEYLIKNPNATKRDVQTKMAFISVGME